MAITTTSVAMPHESRKISCRDIRPLADDFRIEKKSGIETIAAPTYAVLDVESRSKTKSKIDKTRAMNSCVARQYVNVKASTQTVAAPNAEASAYAPAMRKKPCAPLRRSAMT